MVASGTSQDLGTEPPIYLISGVGPSITRFVSSRDWVRVGRGPSFGSVRPFAQPVLDAGEEHDRVGSGEAGATAPAAIFASAMNGDCVGVGAVTISNGFQYGARTHRTRVP